jgi:predicted nucleotide-binding protein
MRPTVRDQYTAALREALGGLREIRQRLEHRDDVVATQRLLFEWQHATADSYRKFLNDDNAKFFNSKFDFNLTGLSPEQLTEGIDIYDDFVTNTLYYAPTIDLKRAYADDVRIPLEQIDELLDQIRDLDKRSRRDQGVDYQTAADGLRRWKATAHKLLTPFLGEEEARQIYSMRADAGSIEEQFEMHETHLMNLKEEIQKYPEHRIAQAKVAQESRSKMRSKDRKVFIAHGHGSHKDAVARVITKLGLEPVILQEKPGTGRTLIDKLEKYSDVGYAVVLLAPDDIGGKKGEEQYDRSRQNVVFELGYFVGKLGRGCVCLLYWPGVEMPSDYFGVEYVLFDDKDAWKYRLAGELKEVGYKIDFNVL